MLSSTVHVWTVCLSLSLSLFLERERESLEHRTITGGFKRFDLYHLVRLSLRKDLRSIRPTCYLSDKLVPWNNQILYRGCSS